MRIPWPAPVAIAAIGLAWACSSTATSPSSASATHEEQLTLKLTTTHFRVLADRAALATLQAIADSLEAAYPRVTADLGTGDLPVVSASVWQDQASFYETMRRNLGQVYTGATGYVTGPQGVALLANASVASSASHEFAHVVSLAVNPTIGNNPRWLWETVALYENRDFVDPSTLGYLQAGHYPTIAALDADYNTSRQIYEVGCVLGEFIVATWGVEGLVRLVRANGQIPSALGLGVREFEQQWCAFLQAKYRTPPPAG
jgi:hypothetical protein